MDAGHTFWGKLRFTQAHRLQFKGYFTALTGYTHPGGVKILCLQFDPPLSSLNG